MMSLFDTSDFVARGHCGGGWTPVLIGMWVVPSVVLCLMYLTVAVVKWRGWWVARGTDLVWWWPFSIALFFIGCAGGHLMNAAAFVWPAYRAFVAWDWLTVGLSAVGLVAMFRCNQWALRKVNRLESDHARADRKLHAAILRAEAAERRAEAAEEKLLTRDRLGGGP